jgi:hypothetical protein
LIFVRVFRQPHDGIFASLMPAFLEVEHTPMVPVLKRFSQTAMMSLCAGNAEIRGR